MTECKRCHTAITMFWWPVSFSGDWEDHFYLCDECMHDLIEFMKKKHMVDPTELLKEENFEDKMICPSCGAKLWLVDAPRRLYGCPTCFRKFDRFGKEVPQ